MKYFICFLILLTSCATKEEILIEKFKLLTSEIKKEFPKGDIDTSTTRIILEQLNPILRIPKLLKQSGVIEKTTKPSALETEIPESKPKPKPKFDPSKKPTNGIADGVDFIIYTKINHNKIDCRFNYEYWIKDNSVYGWLLYSDEDYSVGDKLILKGE